MTRGRTSTKKLLPILSFICTFFPTLAIAEGPSRPPLKVETQQVERATISHQIKTLGLIKAQHWATLKNEVPGVVVSMPARSGQFMNQGDLIVHLDKTIFEAEHDKAKARLLLAENQHRRSGVLAKQGTSSAVAEDEALANWITAKADFSSAEWQLSKTSIQAPFNGYLSLMEWSVGDYLPTGTAVVEIINLDELYCDFTLPGHLHTKVRVQMPYSFEVEEGQAHYEGKVEAISPMLDSLSHQLTVRGAVNNAEGNLKPGQFTKVTFTAESHENVLVIPMKSVQFAGKPIVWTVNDDHSVQPTEVTLGLEQGDAVEIVSGLEEGARIVSAGQIKLYPGASIYWDEESPSVAGME